MTQTDRNPRVALYALLESIEGFEEPTRAAESDQDQELAEFLRRVRVEIGGEARKLLAQRLANGG
jgi:hypothetical protein